MSANMSNYFLSQRHEPDDVLFIKVENDLKYASSDAIHATHISHKIDSQLEVKYSTPHFTAVITALQLKL